MGKVLSFRKAGEACGNCWYYAPRERRSADERAYEGSCRHPDYMRVSERNCSSMKQSELRRGPGEWCPKYVSSDSPEMKKLQTVSGVKFSLLCLKKRPEYSKRGLITSNEYRELVDFFYKENKRLITINQFKAIMRDVDYFITLIDQLFAYYLKKSKSRRHQPYPT